jgi:nicotinamide-nucleotide amidase
MDGIDRSGGVRMIAGEWGVYMNDAELYGLAESVGRISLRHGHRLATAESCTGGWIAEALTAVPGCSAWFDASVVSYSNEAKQSLLGVPGSVLESHGAVSEATVRAMAAGVLARTHASLAVAVSGIAGPSGGSPEKPVGTVWVAWLRADGSVDRVARLALSGDRNAIRRGAVICALEGLIDAARA